MKAKWELPVSYTAFVHRQQIMNLHDAIETPRVESQVRDLRSKTPIEDDIRRMQTLKENNVQILDLDELVKLETKAKPRKTNTIRMPKPKQTLLHRFLKLFR